MKVNGNDYPIYYFKTMWNYQPVNLYWKIRFPIHQRLTDWSLTTAETDPASTSSASNSESQGFLGDMDISLGPQFLMGVQDTLW